MSILLPLLAHIGEAGDPWVGVVTAASLVVMVVFVLVAFDVVELGVPGDLLLPLAAVVLVSGLAGNIALVLDEQSPWIVPVGLALLVGLVVAAFRQDATIEPRSRLTLFSLVGAVALTAVAYNPLADLWVPEEETLPLLEDAVVAAEVVQPPNADGQFVVRVSIENGTLGDGLLLERPDDAETELVPRFQVGPVYLQPPVPDECAAADPCTTADFQLTLPAGFVTEPPDEIVVELLTADKLPFVPPLQDRVELPRAG